VRAIRGKYKAPTVRCTVWAPERPSFARGGVAPGSEAIPSRGPKAVHSAGGATRPAMRSLQQKHNAEALPTAKPSLAHHARFVSRYKFWPAKKITGASVCSNAQENSDPSGKPRPTVHLKRPTGFRSCWVRGATERDQPSGFCGSVKTAVERGRQVPGANSRKWSQARDPRSDQQGLGCPDRWCQ